MDSYTCGFLFHHEHDAWGDVLLVHKKHGPKPVLNRWNGIGGKLKPSEHPMQGLRREFLEETGLDIPEPEWRIKVHLKHLDNKFEVFFGVASVVALPRLEKYHNDVGERLSWWPMSMAWGHERLVPNLKWILPLIIDRDILSSEVIDCVSQ